MLAEEQPLPLNVARLIHELTKRNGARGMLHDHLRYVLHRPDVSRSQTKVDVFGHPPGEALVETTGQVKRRPPVRDVGTTTCPRPRDRRMEVQTVERAHHHRTFEPRSIRSQLRREHQSPQPTSGRNGVVVGKRDERAGSHLHTPVAGGGSTARGTVDIAHPRIARHTIERLVVVVHHDHLVWSIRVLVQDRVKAAAQELRSPTSWDDNAENQVCFGELARVGQAVEDIGALRY